MSADERTAYRTVNALLTEVRFTPTDDPECHRPITVEWRGGDTYCVKQGPLVWDQNAGQWEYEPQPSSREDDFIARTRYAYTVAFDLATRLLGEQINPGASSRDGSQS